MFEIAILIGTYSYIIFSLGLLGLLYKPLIILVTLIVLSIATAYFVKIKKIKLPFLKNIKLDNTSKFIVILIFLQLLVNLIGTLGPEISFDALWYHLTIPKLFLLNHSIFHIPGNLLYYSDMPKLTEMLYIGALSLGNETIAKLLHFLFGVLTLIAIYKITLKFTSQKLALIAVLIFYSNLVVGWESITAYVDLARSFFEIMTLWGFLNWMEKKNTKWLFVSALMIGLAISTKLLALESLIIFLSIQVYMYTCRKIRLKELVKNISIFIVTVIVVTLPWFLFSYFNTDNFLYPFLSKNVDTGVTFILPQIGNLITDFLNLFLFSADPISPIYLILLPILIVLFKKAKFEFKILYIYSIFALLIWYITPKIGGGRFILPYLPVLSILTIYPFTIVEDKFKKLLIILIIFVSMISIGYRFFANYKYVPYILGKETKQQFLTNNLNFSFGDFYDTDNYFKSHIKNTDKVLLIGFHNLYYIDFPYIDSSWVKKEDKYNYIATQNTVISKTFSNWKLIYYNSKTNVKFYKKN